MMHSIFHTAVSTMRARWNESRWLRFVVTVGLVAVALLFFAVLCWKLYFLRFAWGAWGDDSPGYQFLAARIVQEAPLIWQDKVGKDAMDFFEDYRLATWIIPTHHEFIHPNGTIASKYPLGASLVLAAGAWLKNDVMAMYIMNPLSAAAVVFLTALTPVIIFSFLGWRRWIIAFFAPILLIFSPIFVSHALAQPMREIPSMIFLLATLCLFVPTVQRLRRELSRPVLARPSRWTIVGFAVSALFFGAACTVRETSIVILPAFVVYGLAMGVEWKRGEWATVWQRHWKQLGIVLSAFGLFFILGFLPTILNSAEISAHNEPFKARDTGSVVLLSNINHVQSISVRNIFHSEGRYRPDDGSLPAYWTVMNDFTKLPYFVWIVIAGLLLGLWRGNREERAVLVTLALWLLGTLTIFSLWVNPYSRYIMPMLPIMCLLAVYGIVRLSDWVVRPLAGKRVAVAVVVCICVAIIGVAKNEWDTQKLLRGAAILEQRSISQKDADTLQVMASHIRARATSVEGKDGAQGRPVTEENTVVIFTDKWQHGLSEVFWAQTQIRGVRNAIESEVEVNKPSQEQYIQYLKHLLNDEQVRVYLWVGIEPTPEAALLLGEFAATPVYQKQLTFVAGFTLYELQSK